MKTKILILLLSFSLYIYPQRVGLVLSGGGAKGIAHIGLIQVLEDNGIPIDYITGTSMGAIVGALYSMGYSPEEMLKLVKSEEFKLWQSGIIQEEDILYYLKKDPVPELVQLNIDVKKDSTKKTQAYFLPTSLVNPVQMNLAFMKLFSQASAHAEYDFDNLFIPFRCISSDVYHKNALISRKGDLGQAVRASMTFPFVFSPIEIDGNLMYDGGIYNNFPVDVMKDDFNPDIIIGSSVTSNPSKPSARDIMGQMENMIMQKTDYSISEEDGIYIRSHVSQYGLMDFDKADEIYAVGYKMGQQYIDSIKSRISRRVPKKMVELDRMIYKSEIPDFRFKDVIITGVDYAQQQYINSQIRKSDDQTFTFESFKKDYFGLLSDGKITQIIPYAIYSPEDKMYKLHLKVTMKEALSISIGGLISSMNSNEAFLGINYQSLSYFSVDYDLKAHIGNQYNSFEASSRILFPGKFPFYLKLIGVFSQKKFFEDEKRFFDPNMQTFATQKESFVKLRAGIPFFRNGKIEISTSYGEMTDKYIQPQLEGFSISNYKAWISSFKAERNTLNQHMFPDKGSRFTIIAQYALDKERYKRLNNDTHFQTIGNHNWLQLSGDFERYNTISNHFSLGFHIHGVVSNKPLYGNYNATLLQTPAFTPTLHSKVVLNENFRALSFASGGLKPIYLINNKFQVRTEYYVFVPFVNIKQTANNNVERIKGIKKINHFGELSVVYNTPIGSISIFGNYYSRPKSDFNFGLNIGLLLGNSKFIE